MSNSQQSPIVPNWTTLINLFHGYKPPTNSKFFAGYLFYNEC